MERKEKEGRSGTFLVVEERAVAAASSAGAHVIDVVAGAAPFGFVPRQQFGRKGTVLAATVGIVFGSILRINSMAALAAFRDCLVARSICSKLHKGAKLADRQTAPPLFSS